MRRDQRHFSYYEMLDACRAPGCPVCRLGETSARRHLDQVIYDGVNDISLRQTLREALGYCREHAWWLPQMGGSAPLGIAIIHRDVLNNIRRHLQDASFKKSTLRSVMRAINLESGNPTGSGAYLQPAAECPACTRSREAERLALAAMLDALNDEDQAMVEALSGSDGLCVPHLRGALEAAPGQTAFDTLVALTLEQFNTLIGDLDEYIRKRDHRFRDEQITPAESRSWERALERTVGANPSEPGEDQADK